MRKSNVLPWHRSARRGPIKWSPFFATPAQTDALLKPLFEPPAKYHIAIIGENKSPSRYNRAKPPIWLSIFITAVCLLSNQLALAVSPSDNGISILRSEALEADGNGEYGRAESLYQKALAAARQSGSKTKVTEFLSRIVQVRIENHKLLETDAFVQESIQLARAINNTTASDSTLSVWMNDMADAFYSKGEQTAREDIKEYCLKHYLDVKLGMEDRYDPQLLGKANLLLLRYQHSGRYSEALPYAEKLFSYKQRTKSGDPQFMADAFIGLAHEYLLIQDPTKAVRALNQGLQIKKSMDEDIIYEAIADKLLGIAEFETGSFDAARVLYRRALELMYKNIGRENVHTNSGEILLGLLEQRAGNLKEAARLFRASLDGFDNSKPETITPVNKFLHLEGITYSGQVISAEHLAQIAVKQENLPLAQSLQIRARKIRAQNPYWAACNNPAPDTFYMIGGHFPFPIEIIPTRSDMPL
jgi:tetratricopeptide (TPR) repeat protein